MKASEFNKRQKLFELDNFGSVFSLKSIDYNGNSFISCIIMSTGFNKPIKEQYRVVDFIRRNFIYYLIEHNILEETYKGAYEFLGSRDVDIFGNKNPKEFYLGGEIQTKSEFHVNEMRSISFTKGQSLLPTKNFKFDLNSLVKNSLGYVEFSPLLFEPLIDQFNMCYHIFEYNKNKKFIYKSSGGRNKDKNIVILYKDDKLVHHDLIQFKIEDDYLNILNLNQFESFLKAIENL